MIKKNDKGYRVKELKALLKIGGNDYFDANTEMGLKAFQDLNGLPATGIADPITLALLRKHIENRVVPLYAPTISEDKEDDIGEVIEVIEEQAPTSPHLSELAKLIYEAKITRKIERVIFHCTATQPEATVTSIQNYWKNTLGWKSAGYHIMVRADGSWTLLTDFNSISNGVQGKNSTAINISYIGGIDKKGKALDTRTPEQKEVLELCYHLFKEKLPKATFHGHNEFANKACPSFNVKEWVKGLKK